MALNCMTRVIQLISEKTIWIKNVYKSVGGHRNKTYLYYNIKFLKNIKKVIHNFDELPRISIRRSATATSFLFCFVFVYFLHIQPHLWCRPTDLRQVWSWRLHHFDIPKPYLCQILLTFQGSNVFIFIRILKYRCWTISFWSPNWLSISALLWKGATY